MKKITLLSLVAVLLTALTFTSCNTGDDNGYSLLTKEQQDAYQTKMAGSYRNLVLLFDHKNDANVKNQADSVETECYFSMRNDSTFTISNFPIKKLAEHISNPELKEAISKVEDKTVTGMYMVLPNSQTNQAYFYAYPSPINLNLKYGSDAKEHKVVLVFTPDTYYAGGCIWATKQIGFPFYLTRIFVDGAQTNYIKNSINSQPIVSFACRNKVTSKQ
jgi:lipoprotein